MRFARHGIREHRDDHLVPLINVIFLMLIFFMIVGRISPPEPLPVTAPLSEQAHRVDATVPMLLMGADGQLALDGQLIGRRDLIERVAAWRQQPGGSDSAAKTSLTIKADASLRAGDLHATLDLLRILGVDRIALMTATEPRHASTSVSGTP